MSDLHHDLPSMRCLVYCQAWEWLDAGWREAEILERGTFATSQLAKRQITWLRSMPDRVVVDAQAADAVHQFKQTAMQALAA